MIELRSTQIISILDLAPEAEKKLARRAMKTVPGNVSKAIEPWFAVPPLASGQSLGQFLGLRCMICNRVLLADNGKGQGKRVEHWEGCGVKWHPFEEKDEDDENE